MDQPKAAGFVKGETYINKYGKEAICIEVFKEYGWLAWPAANVPFTVSQKLLEDGFWKPVAKVKYLNVYETGFVAIHSTKNAAIHAAANWPVNKLVARVKFTEGQFDD